MKKSLLIICFILILEALALTNPEILISSSKEAMNLFINKLFISLFPFFILNKILIEYNLPYYISKIFKTSNYSISIIILSLLTGMPSNAVYIKDYLDKKIIDTKEAERLLIYTFFPSPVFVITIVGYIYFKSIKIGLILYLLTISFNVLLYLIFKNKHKLENKIMYFNNPKNINLPTILKESIISSIHSLILILGNVLIFILIFNILDIFLNINVVFKSFLSSILELTNGIKKISSLTTNFNLKFSMSLFALTFSGISIYSQISSILSNYKINFKKILLFRFITSLLYSILSRMILQLPFFF